MEKILLPIVVVLLLAGNEYSLTGTVSSQGSMRMPPRTKPADRHPPARTVQAVLTPEEQDELAEGFRVAYNLAEAPDLAAVRAVALRVPRYGASAKGVVVKEKYGELYLDTTPCEPQVRKKQMYTFNSPYRKEEADEITCPKSSVKIKMTKITQRGRRSL